MLLKQGEMSWLAGQTDSQLVNGIYWWQLDTIGPQHAKNFVDSGSKSRQKREMAVAISSILWFNLHMYSKYTQNRF